MMEMDHLVRLIETVSRSGLSRFEYEESGLKIQMEKPEVPQTEAAVPVSAAAHGETSETEEVKFITCPLVGIFYTSPQEGAEPFVKAGDTVKKGQTLAIVEAMKLMNEIESEYDGVVTEVMVSNGEAVEFGQPLFKVKVEKEGI